MQATTSHANEPMAAMKAVVLTGHGGLDRLEYREDWPIPEPGPGEVRIRVGACGLNNTDINTRTAWYSGSVTDGITRAGGHEGYDTADAATGSWSNARLAFPRIQGADAAGRICAVGEGVDPGRMGERVLVDPWLFGVGDRTGAADASYFGSEVDGGFAEYAVVPSGNAVAVDCPLSDAELATFPCAYGTAENLIGRTGLVRGETVVVAGASGGVGSAAVQLCRLRGARVIAITSADKAEPLRRLGADAVVDRRQGDVASAIRTAAGGEVDVALDVVGGSMFTALVSTLRHGGRYSTSGAISGPVVEFDLRQLVYRDLQLTGATIVPAGTMSRIVGLIEQGLLRPLLARTFPLKELAAAQRAFMEKRHVGNIVVEVPG